MTSHVLARRRGFTLIELLVVIAIIAILASILFPVFARARESARQTACRSNVKQILTATQMYTDDYDEVYPIVHAVIPSTTTVIYTWAEALNPYVKNTQVWKCNSDPKMDDNLTLNATPPDTTVTYGYNYRFLHGTAAAGIGKPADTVMLCDRQSYGTDPATAASFNTGSSTENLAGPWYPHNEHTNVGFADGHVKSMKKGPLEKISAAEDGVALTGLDVFELWNLR